MKRNAILLLALIGIVAAGCAKQPKKDTKAAAKTYFDALISLRYPDAEATANGAYILEKEGGEGEAISGADKPYIFVDYTTTDIDGNVEYTTVESIAKRTGSYDRTEFYGPQVWYFTDSYSGVYAGLQEGMEGMRPGERRKIAVPFWLLTYDRYSTTDKYLEKSAEGSHIIYEVTLRSSCPDIKEWQGQQLDAYAKANLAGADSTHIAGDEELDKFGFYFVSKGLADEKFADYEMPKDTTLYLDYTGRLPGGFVFDTTIEKVAKDAGVYSPSRTYEPLKVNRTEDYTKISYSNSTGTSEGDLIQGFKAAIYMMRPTEKAVTAFWSELGYGASGYGYSIPSYSPLIFELELVAKPE
jgi:FKBP-type peptidyl-prolyl cis-trans isomerase